jgi:hypothetical protein
MALPIPLSAIKHVGIDILDNKPIDIPSVIIIKQFHNSMVLGLQDPCGVGGRNITQFSSVCTSLCWINFAILEKTEFFEVSINNVELCLHLIQVNITSARKI